MLKEKLGILLDPYRKRKHHTPHTNPSLSKPTLSPERSVGDNGATQSLDPNSPVAQTQGALTPEGVCFRPDQRSSIGGESCMYSIHMHADKCQLSTPIAVSSVGSTKLIYIARQGRNCKHVLCSVLIMRPG